MRETYTPDRVAQLMSLHQTRMERRAPVWRMLNAAYLTRFWEYVGMMPAASRWARWNVNGTEVEVNKLWRRVMTYKAALYRNTSRIECGPDPIMDRGDPSVASAVSNAMWVDETTAEQMDRAVEMAILFPGSGFKVGVDAGRAPPVRRVWTRVIPWWEMVLDADVSDIKDERFRGHRYWAPKSLIEDTYNVKGLVGRRRMDFMLQDVATEVDKRDFVNTESDQDGEFVEVLELSNFVDWVKGPSGGTYKGRQEVYVLGQADKFKTPVSREALAFADADGVGMSHIEPLIFCHEPSFPLRGVSPCERILPQLRETNVYRTHMAEILRRNARKFLYRKGSLTDDQLDKLMSSVDMVFCAIEDETVELATILRPVPEIPISAEFWHWMDKVGADDDQAWGQSGPATGQSSDKGKTAFAVNVEDAWTKSELGYHGQCLTSAVKRLTRLRLRAVIHAMQSVGDAAGGENAAGGPGTELAPIGVTTTADPSAPGVAVADADDGTVGSAVPIADVAEVAVASGEVTEATATASKVQVQEFIVKDQDGNPLNVTVPALDGDFEIKYVDGGRTHMADAALLSFLSTQGTTYFEWFKLVMAGGPLGIVARAWMQEMAAVAQLPASLHVETLERKAKETGKMPTPETEAPPPAMPPGAAEAEPEQVAAQPVEGAQPAARGDALTMALAEVKRGLTDAATAAPEIADTVQHALAALQGAGDAVAKKDAVGVVHALSAVLDALEPLANSVPDVAAPSLSHAVEVADQVRRALMKMATAPKE